MNNSTPLSLRQLPLRYVYNRNNCPDLLGDFYIPALRTAVEYDRATYTFNGRTLSVAAAGIAGLVNNGGRMRLVCHHELSPDVVHAIEKGLVSAESAVVKSLGNRLLTEIDPDDWESRHHLELLTWLVKEGRLDIKWRYLAQREKGILFHRKGTFITDMHGDMIAFEGSLNESERAWLHNDESFNLFNSWEAESLPGGDGKGIQSALGE